MIYTVGHRDSYRQGLAQSAEGDDPLMKLGKGTLPDGKYYEGGGVWKTQEEAYQYLIDKDLVTFDVFGVDADWDSDTEQLENEAHRRLINTSLIIDIGYPLEAYIDGKTP